MGIYKQVVVEAFGGIDQLKIVERQVPEPGPGQVRVRLTSIGMNHADLMARQGMYKLSSGDPPFTPGLEGGGVIDAIGPDVSERTVGQRVILGVDVPRLGNAPQPGSTLSGAEGTYRTHYICDAAKTLPAPDAIDDDQLGAIWLAYLTVWGCFVWKEKLETRPGSVIALPAASSGVAVAASQVAKRLSADNTVIGLTTSPEKVEALGRMPEAKFDHLVVTRDEQGGDVPWHREIKQITDGRGVDVFFDPVAAGAYLETEIRCLAQDGVVWVYGLLGQAGKVDVTPLIRKHAAIRGWAQAELVAAGPDAFEPGYRHILEGFASGAYRQRVAQTFALDDVRQAHETMEGGRHIGKLVLKP